MQLFDVEEGVLLVRSHPGLAGVQLAVTACVALSIAVSSAPESLAVGSDLTKFAVGALLAVLGTVAADLHHFIPASAPPAPEPEQPRGEDTEAQPEEALPEAEIEVDDAPTCVKCEGSTAWVAQTSRYRCQKCGLYQPLHAPGSQVDCL